MDSFEGRIHLAVRAAIKGSHIPADDHPKSTFQVKAKEIRVARARELRDVIPKRFTSAADVSEGAMTTVGPFVLGLETVAYDLRWIGSFPHRQLRLVVDSVIGTIEWDWSANSITTRCQVDARDFSERNIESLIFALVDNILWEQGRFPSHNG
jgi:hypothetical protein